MSSEENKKSVFDLFVKILRDAKIDEASLSHFINDPAIKDIESLNDKEQQRALYEYWFFQLYRHPKETMEARTVIVPDKDIPEWLTSIVDHVAPMIIALNLPYRPQVSIQEEKHEEQKTD